MQRSNLLDASHELGHLFPVIKANCQYALKFAEGEDDFRESLKAIEDQADRASVLLSLSCCFSPASTRSRAVFTLTLSTSARSSAPYAQIERSCFPAALV